MIIDNLVVDLSEGRSTFLSSVGTPVLDESLRKAFREIMIQIGLRTEQVRPRARLPALRRSHRPGTQLKPLRSRFLACRVPVRLFWAIPLSPMIRRGP